MRVMKPISRAPAGASARRAAFRSANMLSDRWAMASHQPFLYHARVSHARFVRVSVSVSSPGGRAVSTYL